MSSHLKAELAATCSTLGHLHKGNYLIEPECFQSVKDLIHYLKRDNETHEIRRYLGESKVLQNDLIQIIKNCPKENSDLFSATLRLLINLTTPTLLFYGEDVPVEKSERNIYLSLTGHAQDYKLAFCDVEFWNKICGKLTDLFEIDWADRSADEGIQIERILMLLRNVLQVPADQESEKRPENDITVHDKMLWTLRQAQILELLLFVSSDKNEEQCFLNLLEIFSLILREQNPKLLAHCDVQRSADEKIKDTEDLLRVRESEKKSRNKYLNMRNFNATFIMKGVKSLSNRDIVCHKSLDKVSQLDLSSLEKKQIRPRRSRVPVESDLAERRSTFFVRLFLKEFCVEFLNSSFKHLMSVVKNKLDSGKTLANDQTYYFWALKFFLDFATATNSDVDLIKDLLTSESFHFVQTSMDNAFEHLVADKNKTVSWVKRIHLILKAYRSLLETLLWMDCSRSALTRSVSRAIKSQIFYVVEYREMTLHLLLRYDPTKFSVSYLRDLIETTHLFIKLLEEYSKEVKLVVQRITKKKTLKKKSTKIDVKGETREEKWAKIKDDLYDTLCSETAFPEIPPFDAALEIPIDDQKGRAMKSIQEFLHEGRIKDAIGLWRSSRLVWPENDYFGFEGMSVEDETTALQEICLADLERVEGRNPEEQTGKKKDEREDEDSGDECKTQVVEQDFDITDYKKRLVNRRVVEGCGILLRDYKKNSDHTNHCVIKLLHRIGWECCMPAMLFQASIFWTLLKIFKDNSGNYNEIHTFTVNLLRKFRKYAIKNPVVFLELLFWKERNVALEIQHGYEPYDVNPKTLTCSAKKKSKGKLSRDEEEQIVTKKKKRNVANLLETNLTEICGRSEGTESDLQVVTKGKKNRKRKAKGHTEEIVEHSLDVTLVGLDSLATAEGRVVICAAGENPCALDDGSVKSKTRIHDNKNFAMLDNSGDTEECQHEIVQNAKSQDADGNIVSSSDEENASGTNCSLSAKALEMRRRNRKTSKTRKEVGTESGKFENYGRASNKLRIIYSSESEGEITAKPKQANDGKSKTGEQMSNRHQVSEAARKHFSQEKESISQMSSLFLSKRPQVKKGKREDFSENPEQSSISTLKRLRLITSDSDTENVEEGDAEQIFLSNGSRKKKRLTVIDSDSDAED